ncbi:MAG: tRNA (uridine(34)/cytosine(34)/5-carboxymethylaminomethyluridine(34)-2'-O)-methyltransferase TrmL [Spirochaetales bacterium]|nr:tRNA (uridine(34)/cytosine(34)/5-carboxymethylaminomethyluridine(34)-2'-O)-methyltransferase TrmL [Spirochaetales bacterium]
MSINIVLIEPEIPQNTGNIARTCAATNIPLHLVKPYGFSIDDKQVKRAGLDYWHLVDVHEWESLDHFLEANREATFRLVTTKGKNNYTELDYPDHCFLLFGKETKGLPEELLKKYPEKCIRIPMVEESRSLNLSNAAAILAYEALRQQGFPGLKIEGTIPE